MNRQQNTQRRKSLGRRSHEGLRLDGIIKAQTEAELANDNHGFLPAGFLADKVVSDARDRQTKRTRKGNLLRVSALMALVFLVSFLAGLWVGWELYSRGLI